MSDQVILQCVKEKSKLRVRILTNGYLKSANCQFPKDIRTDGQLYRVNKRSIKLITTRGKYYYCVKNKNDIELISEVEKVDLSKVQVYEDETQEECLICCEAKKSVVFYPCGHYYTCGECSSKVDRCPICREEVTSLINKDDME